MNLEVRFDGVLIDEQYYTGLTNNNELFNESFKLGAVPCNQYILRVAKEGVSQQPSEITLSDGVSVYANLTIDNIEEQDYEYVYTLTDRMVNLDFYYDASEIFVGGSTTLYNIANDICTRVGLTLGTPSFRGYDKIINWYDNTKTARQYIGYIAELNGGFARIEGNNLYFVKQKTSSVKTINIEDCEDFKIGERHVITRVVYEMGALKYEFGSDTGNTLYLNSENVFITEESEVEDIYNEINGFVFYSFTTSNCPIDYNVKAGDVITFTDGTNSYPTIAQYDLEFYGGWIGGYSLEVNTQKQEETKVVGNKENIRNIRILVDRQNGTIEQVVEQVGEQNNKISSVTQSVDEINSKIQDIADITTQKESYQAQLSFENINESEPIAINIHPTLTNISYLYPRDNLYPSDNLLMPDRIIRFIRTYTEEGTTKTENIDYILPDDLLYYDSEHYDEFILNYDTETCQVIKKCKYNADGTVGLLTNTVTTDYPYPLIELGDGDHTIIMPGYNAGYLSVRLMANNIYTTQFATKTEVRSEINQTANQITSTVSETYTTKNEANQLSSRINQTAKSIELSTSDNGTSAGITIKLKNEDGTQIDEKSGNITMNGLVKFTDLSSSGSTTINGSNITTGTINADRVSGGTLTGTTISGNTITGGTISGTTINTDKNMTIGDNLYVGQNQSSSGADQKFMYLSENSYIRRIRSGGSESLSLNCNDFIQLKIAGDNKFSCGGTNTSTQISANTDIYLNAGRYIYETVQPTIISDERLKENIKNIDVDFINDLKVKEFEYKHLKGVKQIGLIAQDYIDKDYSKYFLNQNEEGYYSIAYGNITNALIQYAQELNKKINSQQELINNLTQRLDKLEGGK